MPIQSIYITPGIAVARLGAATAPVCNYQWVDVEQPRYDGETTIAPTWSLEVGPDGSVTPVLPDAIEFRDGDKVRPVAPFFEVWARVGPVGSSAESWEEAPLTPALLVAEGLSPADLKISVTATNRKAARRSGNAAVAFGTREPVVLQDGDHSVKTINGVSPAGSTPPMIPSGRAIPLGSVQLMKNLTQPLGQSWSDSINLEVFRFRYRPAAGLFYGPPEAAQAQPAAGRPEPAVQPENAFLDPGAGWFNVATNNLVEPGDTYDVVDQTAARGPSLGVVDDTCEVHFEAALTTDGVSRLSARAVVFVAPPDFAPDRRPFLSVADELNDRTADWSTRNGSMNDDELDQWTEDFFERVYETVSLFNVDHYREDRAGSLPPTNLRANDLDDGQRAGRDRALGGRDGLRNELYKLSSATQNHPLPLSEHARMRHRQLSDLQNVEALVLLDPNRLKNIIRPPFERENFENGDESSMRMPPFMRQSNALPLSVAGWQYELLMRWLNKTIAKQQVQPMIVAGLGPQKRTLSESAATRRDAVLSRLVVEQR
ncbi:UNVERIFIED_ORG: hypothetical protein GGD51_005139 [Rhizobium esperanzae]